MSNGEAFQSAPKPFYIADRIGPIFDPAFLKLIPRDKIKEIAVIQLKAQAKAMREELKGIEEVVKAVEGIQVKG